MAFSTTDPLDLSSSTSSYSSSSSSISPTTDAPTTFSSSSSSATSTPSPSSVPAPETLDPLDLLDTSSILSEASIRELIFGSSGGDDIEAALNCSGINIHRIADLLNSLAPAPAAAAAESSANVTTTAATITASQLNGSWPISASDPLSALYQQTDDGSNGGTDASFAAAHGNINSSSLATLLTKGSFSSYSSNLTTLLDLFDTNDPSSPRSHCPSRWYGLSCWHRTTAGQEAVISCPSVLNGIFYDTTQNASRNCLPNGVWAEKANYERCLPIPTSVEDTLPSLHHTYVSTIFYAGYAISLIALTIALFILLYFKDLRCVRNTIHTNLMSTYLLLAIFWIIMDQLHSNPSQVSRNISCYLEIGFRYLMATNFFWMFVEGLYLYLLVVKTFSIDMIRSAYYFIIGWGLPAVVITVWVLMKKNFTRTDAMIAECIYMRDDEFDYFYKVPVLAVLFVNIFFLGKIMWLLIVKLRSQLQNQSAESKQYHKAAKALLVLIPLLGVGYMLLLVTPTQDTWRMVFKVAQAVLTSTQGFTVAVLYCFCNGEVRHSVRNHIERARLRRTLRYGGDYPTPSTNNLYWRPHNYHNGHNNNNNNSHRKHYTFKSLKTNQANGTRTANGTTSNGPGNGTARKASSTGTNGSTPGRSGRYSNASESAITSARMYRTTGRGDKCRGDSCVSFTTTSSYVILASGGSGGPSGTATLVGTGNGSVSPRLRPSVDFGTAGNGHARNGYRSVSTSPEDEQINIELQPI